MPHNLSNPHSFTDNAESQDKFRDIIPPRARNKTDPDRHLHLPSAEHCLLQRGCLSDRLSPDHRNAPGYTDDAAPAAWPHGHDNHAYSYFHADYDAHPPLPGQASHPLLAGRLSEKLRAALDLPCLFYPGAGTDVDPALLFTSTGVVSTVVYADYLSRSMSFAIGAFDWFENCRLSASDDMKPLCDARPRQLDSGILTPNDFGFDSLRAFYPNCHTWGSYSDENRGPDAAIGRWALFELESVSSWPVLFLYFCTEAIQTYINLWGVRGTAPLAVVVQNHGKGGLWTRLDGDCLLYAASPKLPKYTYVGDISSTPWPGYRQLSRDRIDDNSMHRSHRALFEAKSHFGINFDSPMHQWDGVSNSLVSKKYPDFQYFNLAIPRQSSP